METPAVKLAAAQIELARLLPPVDSEAFDHSQWRLAIDQPAREGRP